VHTGGQMFKRNPKLRSRETGENPVHLPCKVESVKDTVLPVRPDSMIGGVAGFIGA
jgi:hypothetical protein